MSLQVAAKTTLGSFSLDATFGSEGRVTALFGRSGSGKTTLINIIAGLLRPERGRVVVDGTVLFDSESGINVPAHKRRIGYVFQEGRLFPHLTVKRNLTYGSWFTPKEARRVSLDEVVELLGLNPLLERGTAQLSGGEKQRVAIGRALLCSPRLLLMDEPLASLDDARKSELMPFLERLRDDARVPIIYVSHSVPEVVRLATTLVLLSEGRVVATGPTSEVMGRLDLFPITGPVEAGAVIEGTVEAHDALTDLTHVRSRAGLFRVPRLELAPGASVRMRVRARDVMIAVKPPEGLSALNVLPGKVIEVGPLHGPAVDIALDCGGERVLAELTRYSVESLHLAPGREVFALIKSVAFDQVSGLARAKQPAAGDARN
jgi:molybdate transport system ATP-binding protein